MNISDFFKMANSEGLPVPLARDSAKNQPSVTLLFVYVTSLLAIVSLIVLHMRADAVIATAASCIYSIVWTILYMIRQLHKVKFDVDDQSVELEGEDNEKNP